MCRRLQADEACGYGLGVMGEGMNHLAYAVAMGPQAVECHCEDCEAKRKEDEALVEKSEARSYG